MIGNTVKIKSGFGYWDITHYPLGGKFCRAGKDGVLFKITKVYTKSKYTKGCDTEGISDEGIKAAFAIDNTVGWC